MDVIFNPYLSTSIFFRPDQMYGEGRKIFEELPQIANGNIYFLAERRKVRVAPNSVDVSSDGHISVTFTLEDGSNVRSTFPFAPAIIQLGTKFLEIFRDAETLQRHVIGVENHDEYLAKQSNVSGRPFVGVSLDQVAQNRKNIALCLYTPDGRIGKMPLTIHSVLGAFNIDIGDHPRILYIGKSEHLKDRIYRHEKIQEALSTIDDESDLYLYAFQFDTNKLTKLNVKPKTVALKRDFVNDISSEAQLAIVEMCLINYFKPRLNKDYKDADISANAIFQTALKGLYTQVVLEVDHETGFWNFGTEHVKANLRHQIEYPVDR